MLTIVKKYFLLFISACVAIIVYLTLNRKSKSTTPAPPSADVNNDGISDARQVEETLNNAAVHRANADNYVAAARRAVEVTPVVPSNDVQEAVDRNNNMVD